MDYRFNSGLQIRELCRAGEFTGPTAGVARAYVQANLVILPQAWAADFERFYKLNPKPCPLLEVTEPGSFEAKRTAPGSDLRTDLPAYRVYRNGELVERCASILGYWAEGNNPPLSPLTKGGGAQRESLRSPSARTEVPGSGEPPSLLRRGLGEVSHSGDPTVLEREETDPPLSPLVKGGGAQRESLRSPFPQSPTSADEDRLVAFLIGCSFTFEQALIDAGIPVRHIEENRNVPMFRTNRECTPAGAFSGPLVVSMRPMTLAQAEAAARITERMPQAHGGPVQVGDPLALGIHDVNRPDYGDAVTIRAGEVPVFWACGVTPMEAIMRAKPPLAITHEPGHMFVTDLKYREMLLAMSG